MIEALWVVGIALLAGYLLRDRKNEKLPHKPHHPDDKFTKGEGRYLDFASVVWGCIMIIMIACAFWFFGSLLMQAIK